MPGLWSRQEQDEIASILNGRGHKHRVVDGEQPYALSGKMYCRECGRWFVGTSGTGKSGKTYYYYRCPKCRRTFRRDLIEDAVSDSILESIHDPKVRERIIATLEMMITETAEDGAPKESERITAEIRRIDSAFERIWHAIEDGIAPPGGKDRVEELKPRQAALKEELKKWLSQLAADEMKDPTRYRDSGMLFRLPNGLAVEPVLIRKKFLKWQDAHPEFPRIVFHGLRHSSATYQLMISGGDVKAVQGTTGHATADMLVNTYAHIQQSSRVELGKKFEEGFYAKQETPSPQAVPTEGEPTISMTALLELLKNADPEVKAQLRLALLT